MRYFNLLKKYKYKIKKSRKGIEAINRFCNSIDVINFNDASMNITVIKPMMYIFILYILKFIVSFDFSINSRAIITNKTL